MAEVSFTKSFLASLDSKPIKVPADTVYDPQTFAPRFPITLPRLSDPPHPPMPKKIKTTAPPGSSKGINIHLKSARNPVLDIKLANVALATATVHELKDAVHQRIRPTNSTNPDERVPLDKIKLLWKRKPVQGTSIADILTDEPDIIDGKSPAEFSVMVLGGASAISEEELKAAAATKADKPAVALDSPEDTEMKNPDEEENLVNVAAMRAEFQACYDSFDFWAQVEEFIESRMDVEPEYAGVMVTIFQDALKAYLDK
ncbi:hypothetical protein MferCBS31731_003341 [Microsporum ferrugineum]